MTALDDLELVVSLALLTEDRSPQEQRALLRVAVRIEADRNSTTSENMRQRWQQPPSVLVDWVERYQDVRLNPKDREKVDRRRQGFLDAHSEPFARWCVGVTPQPEGGT